MWAAPSIYNTNTLKSFKELGLESQRVKKFASKLHVHSMNFAAKLVHTRRALSSTVINSHQEPVSDQACNPPDPHWFFLSFFAVEELYGTRYQSGSFSLIYVGSGFYCLRSFFFLHTSTRDNIHMTVSNTTHLANCHKQRTGQQKSHIPSSRPSQR